MGIIMSKYQNIQTKCQDMQYKKQLKTMHVGEKPLDRASNGMDWKKQT